MSFFKVKPYRDKKYLKYVSSLPCSCCGIDSDTVIPHHLIGVGQGTMGGKAGDDKIMPLCYGCHVNIHMSTENRDRQFEWISNTLAQAEKDGFNLKTD